MLRRAEWLDMAEVHGQALSAQHSSLLELLHQLGNRVHVGPVYVRMSTPHRQETPDTLLGLA